MSEYSKFLEYFHNKKAEEKARAEEAGAAVPAEPAVPAPQPEADAPDALPPQDVPSRAQEKRFIRQAEDRQAVSADGEDDGQPETELEKYTDRLSSAPADGKEHTGYTGKIDTTTANAAGGEDDTRVFPEPREISGSVFESAQAAQMVRPAQQSMFADGSAEEKTKTITLPPQPSAFPQTNADNAPTRHIGTGKGSLLMEIAKSSAEEAGEDPDQLILEGFFNQEEKQNEEDARAAQELRQELSKTRQNRINSFHFWNKATPEVGSSPDEAFGDGQEKISIPKLLSRFSARFEGIDSAFLKFNCDEYENPNEHHAVFKQLIDIRRNTLIRAIILGVLGLVLLIINLCASASAASHNGFINIMGGNTDAYITTNLVFLVLASFVVFDDIRNGIISLLQGRPKTDASLVFLLTTAFAQLVASYLTEHFVESDYHLLTGGVILLLVPLQLAKMFYYDNTRHCFKSVVAKSEKSYLRTLSDKATLSAVLAESNHEDATVVYPGRTRFIRNFIRRSRSSAAGGQISSRITLISMAASFLIGIVTMIAKGNVLWGLSAMCFSAALSFPVGCVFFTGFMIANENQALSVKSSFVRSYSDARDLAAVDNVVLKAEDIFSVEVTETVCTKGVTRNQAEFCAAVLTDKTGGLLKKAFRNAEGLKTEKLPEVERLTYEDRLGFSAWINDCRVLLGSNAFLVNHNVRMPDESGVLNFIDSENKPLYLAIEGHFTAMFSTRYTCSSEHIKSLKALADNGTNILIVASDPNITDAFAEKLLELPADSVRVISNNAGARITALQNTVTDAEDTGIVFTPNCETLCRCAASAVKLDKLKKLSKLICEICCCAGMALAALFALSLTVSAVSAWLTVLLQLLGAALCFFLPPLLTASSLPAFGRSKVRPVPVGEPYTPENFVPRPQRITDEEEEEEEEEVRVATPADPYTKPGMATHTATPADPYMKPGMATHMATPADAYTTPNAETYTTPNAAMPADAYTKPGVATHTAAPADAYTTPSAAMNTAAPADVYTKPDVTMNMATDADTYAPTDADTYAPTDVDAYAATDADEFAEENVTADVDVFVEEDVAADVAATVEAFLREDMEADAPANVKPFAEEDAEAEVTTNVKPFVKEDTTADAEGDTTANAEPDVAANAETIAEAPAAQEEPEAYDAYADRSARPAPEPVRKKRFGFSLWSSGWDDDYDYDDDDDDYDDDFGLPPRREGRLSKALRARFGKNGGEDDPYAQADFYDQQDLYGRPAPYGQEDDYDEQAEPDAEEQPAEEPQPAAEDEPISTEELLKSSFFRDEEGYVPPEEPSRPRAGTDRSADDGTDRYDAYEEDDEDDFGDGLIGKLHNKGNRGKAPRGPRQHAPSRPVRRPQQTGPSRPVRRPQQNGPVYSESAPEAPVQTDEYYEAPAQGSRRHGGMPAANAGLSDTVRGLSARMTSFTKPMGKKDEEPFDEYDYPQEERQTFLTSSSPATAKPARYDDDGPSLAEVRSAFSLPAEDPAPPKYDLSRNDEYDFLDTKFVPPPVRPGDFYNDSYFSRYDVGSPAPAPEEAAKEPAKDAPGGSAAREPAFAGAKRPKRRPKK